MTENPMLAGRTTNLAWPTRINSCSFLAYVCAGLRGGISYLRNSLFWVVGGVAVGTCCAGCTSTIAHRISWRSVDVRGSIEVGTPECSADQILLPLTFTSKPHGDSLSQVRFHGRISGDTIFLWADLTLPEAEELPYLVRIPAEDVNSGLYFVVYQGRDGRCKHLGTAEIVLP